jgi:predicted nucleic acid-binding protein
MGERDGNVCFDASFAAALILPDEKTEPAEKCYTAISVWDTIFVPHLWWYEIGNILRKSVIRKRHTYDEVLTFFPQITALGATTDSALGALYTQKLFQLANDYELSVYDAAYLELSLRKHAVLCALDKGLRTAGISAGLTVLPNYS